MPRKVDGVDIIESNRFSQFVHPHDVEGMNDLRNWLAWFKKDGINAALIFTDKGYAVYRDGMEDFLYDVD